MRVAIYIRVSTLRQSEEGYSLENQERVLVDYANQVDWNISGIFKDVDSGAKFDKSGLNNILELAEERQIDVVLVLDQDRLSRLNMIEWELLKSKLRENDVKIAQPGKLTDLTDENSEFVSDLLNLIAIAEEEKLEKE